MSRLAGSADTAPPLITNVVPAAVGTVVSAAKLALKVSFPSNPLNVFWAPGWTWSAWILKVPLFDAVVVASPSSIVLVSVPVVWLMLYVMHHSCR